MNFSEILITIIFCLITAGVITGYYFLLKRRRSKEIKVEELNKQSILVEPPKGDLRLKSFSDVLSCGLQEDDVFVQYALTTVNFNESTPIFSDFYKIITTGYSDPLLNNPRFGLFMKIESQELPNTFNLYRRYTNTNYDPDPDKSTFTKIQNNIDSVSVTDSVIYLYDIPDTKDIPDFCTL